MSSKIKLYPFVKILDGKCVAQWTLKCVHYTVISRLGKNLTSHNITNEGKSLVFPYLLYKSRSVFLQDLLGIIFTDEIMIDDDSVCQYLVAVSLGTSNTAERHGATTIIAYKFKQVNRFLSLPASEESVGQLFEAFWYNRLLLMSWYIFVYFRQYLEIRSSSKHELVMLKSSHDPVTYK